MLPAAITNVLRFIFKISIAGRIVCSVAAATSMTTSTPLPEVISRTRSRRSSFSTLILKSAPKRLAKSSLLDVAKRLVADCTIKVETEDLRERVREITSGRGVDVVIDVAAATEQTILPAMDILNMKRSTLVIAAGNMNQTIANFPLGIIKLKYMAIKAARGHSYNTVEMALRTIASGRFPLDALCSHQFDLSHVDEAIRTASGEGLPDPR